MPRAGCKSLAVAHDQDTQKKGKAILQISNFEHSSRIFFVLKILFKWIKMAVALGVELESRGKKNKEKELKVLCRWLWPFFFFEMKPSLKVIFSYWLTNVWLKVLNFIKILQKRSKRSVIICWCFSENFKQKTWMFEKTDTVVFNCLVSDRIFFFEF